MNKSTIFAVTLPLAVLAAWEARLEWLIHSGTTVNLAVGGFDPRDLLAGHYLTYSVNYGSNPPCQQDYIAAEAREDTCVCLSENASTKTHESTWAGACDERPAQCGTFIKGTCVYTMFSANIERFYFPESFRSTLAVVPEKSTVRVVVTQSGQAFVTGFAVDGVDVVEYAKSHTTVP